VRRRTLKLGVIRLNPRNCSRRREGDGKGKRGREKEREKNREKKKLNNDTKLEMKLCI